MANIIYGSVHLQFNDMNHSMFRTKIYPRNESIESVTGCPSGSVAAKFVLRAKSICSLRDPFPFPSIAFPFLSKVLLYQRQLSCDHTIYHLFGMSQGARLLIPFKSCETISFCLDDPILNLTQRNETSAQSTALIHSCGIFDLFASATQSLGTSIKIHKLAFRYFWLVSSLLPLNDTFRALV